MTRRIIGWATVLGVALALGLPVYRAYTRAMLPNIELPAAMVQGPDANGFYWVDKVPAGGWTGGGGDPTQDGASANIGQAVVEITIPGRYRFSYWVNSTGFVHLKSLQVLVFPEAPLLANGVITRKDIIAHEIYPYDPKYPMTVEFNIPKSGVYRIAYGPFIGGIIFRQELADWQNQHNYRARLGLKLTGPGRVRWIDLERPVDVRVFMTPTETIVFEEPVHLSLWERARTIRR